MREISLGLLGASSIAPTAIVEPAGRRSDVSVTSVAARSFGRAREYASAHGIQRAAESYETLIHDPSIDVVYISTAASDHAEWAIAALRAGKHVLCEKPAALTGRDARAMVDIAQDSGLVLAEAFHYAYHPLFAEVESLVRSGRFGRVRSMRSVIRGDRTFDSASVLHDPAVGGGAFRHSGTYALHWMRRLASAEPEAISVHAEPNALGADHTSTVSIGFANGIAGEIVASWTSGPGRMLTIELEGAKLDVDGLIAPHGGHSLRLQKPGSVSRVRTVAGLTSYDYQLAALVAAVRDGEPMSTSGEDLTANADALDWVYRAMNVESGAS